MGAGNRRAFIGIAAAVPFATALRAQESVVRVLAGQDRFGDHKGLGTSTIDIKVSAQDNAGGTLVIENTNRGKGGPARHLHMDQDEHFYVLEGDRLLITFAPAGRMEAFFREVAKSSAMPPQDPALWRAHGMELLGPPLPPVE